MPKFVAIVGGSCSGKTWLAGLLEQRLQGLACRLSQDNFYFDRSHLSMKRREQLNFDHPRAVDWATLENLILESRVGQEAAVPSYDFSTHSRQGATSWAPKPIVLMEGLWLLRRRAVRNALALSIYLEAPRAVCAERRLQRDQAERGRTRESIEEQLRNAVFPMHDRFVAPQARWADIVLQQPPADRDVEQLAAQIKRLISH